VIKEIEDRESTTNNFLVYKTETGSMAFSLISYSFLPHVDHFSNCCKVVCSCSIFNSKQIRKDVLQLASPPQGNCTNNCFFYFKKKGN
jgi:hypothetical protein